MNLIDTSVLIEDLRTPRPRTGCISVITLIEVLRGLPEEKRRTAKELLEEAFDVVQLTNPVVETYCSLYRELRRRGEPSPDADLLIASCAMAQDLALMSRDASFRRLQDLGLRLADPDGEGS
jgi:predicted nucleic acid-binding protein